MARPSKIGLDYFPLDCNPDKKLKAIIRKFGAEGFGVVIGLFQHIYSEGYFVKWTNDFAEDFALEMNVDESILDDVLSFCIKREMFDNDLFKKKKILTSNGIQKRYLLATERRKCKHIDDHNLINVDINEDNGNKNEVNEDISTQSKVKKSKVKKSKVKKSIKDITPNESETTPKEKTFKQWDKDDFWKELLKSNEEKKFTIEMINEFYLYWSEPNDKNKMRLQLEKTWDTGRRLSKWKKNNFSNQSTFNLGQQKHEQVGQVLRPQGEVKIAPEREYM